MEQKICVNLDDRVRVQLGSGSTDYAELSNKPQINGVTLENNKTAQELNLAKNTDLGRFYDFYLKSIDSVFLGIEPELEILETPVQLVVASGGIGYAEGAQIDLVLAHCMSSSGYTVRALLSI